MYMVTTSMAQPYQFYDYMEETPIDLRKKGAVDAIGGW